MALVSPPPTYAEVILVDAQGKRPRFNPIWLKWFIDLAGTINAAGGTTILHNDTGSIQGGSASERYHLTSVQHGVTTAADWAALIALGAGILAKTAAATYAARTITGTASQIVVANGAGTAGNPTLSLAAGALVSGVYTPGLTNVANLDASTAYECQYLRVGATVFVSGKVDVDPTAPAAATQLGIGLPVASNFGATEDCGGAAAASAIAGQSAAILADVANDRAEMNWIAGDVTNQPMYFTFGYQVI